MRERTIKLSIIIPVYNEALGIAAAVAAARRLLSGRAGEIIVADASPDGTTLAALPDGAAVKLTAPAGRGAQMNAGARLASGDALLFLHADTRLPENAAEAIAEALADPRCGAGAFRLKIDSASLWLRFVAWTANVRNFFTGIPYGDQGIFIRKDLFFRLGGYRELPLMEDLDLMERVKAARGGIRILRGCALTSPRRWETDGMVRTTAMHHLLRFLWALGADPAGMAAFRKRPSLSAWLAAFSGGRRKEEPS